MHLTPDLLDEYAIKCRTDGQSEETIKVKLRNLRIFYDFCGKKDLTPRLMSRWRDYLSKRYKTPHSRNNMICKTNVFLEFLGLQNLRMKTFEVDYHKLHSKKENGMTLDDLKKMLDYTEKTKNYRENLLLRVLVATGIRSGEIHHITVEAASSGSAEFIHHKNPRKVLLPKGLCELLKNYAHSQGITTGPIFITWHGNPLHLRVIGTYLKNIAEKVGVSRDKVNPTAFRILFANRYYEKYGDISGLTDLLGVKNLNMAALYVKDDDVWLTLH